MREPDVGPRSQAAFEVSGAHLKSGGLKGRGSSAAAPLPPDDEVERSLLARVAKGDQHAFGELYDLVARRLHGLIRAIVDDGAAADDVLQESFLQIWQKAPTFDPTIARPLVWMMLVARGKAIDHLRRRKAHASAIDRLAAKSVADATPAPHRFRPDGSPASAEEGGLARQARRAVAALPPEQRETILMSFQGGMSGSEIARHHGVPLGTVKTRIRLGMLRLREAFAAAREVPA